MKAWKKPEELVGRGRDRLYFGKKAVNESGSPRPSSASPRETSTSLDKQHQSEDPGTIACVTDGASSWMADTGVASGAAKLSTTASRQEEVPSDMPNQAPLPEPQSNSALDAANEGGPKPSSEENTTETALVVGTLWKKASDELDHKDRTKLAAIISQKPADQLDVAGDSPAPEVVSVIVSRANKLREKHKKASWTPVNLDFNPP